MPKYNILIVDDDDLVREVMKDIIERAGHKTFELASAIGVSATIRKENIDAVILDVRMPSISGNKISKMLRQNKLFDKVATILVSGCDSKELRDLAKSAEADAYILKQDLGWELLKTVHSVIRKRQNSK